VLMTYSRALLALTVLSLPAFGLDVPTGTELQIRLKTKVSTQSSKPHDRVEAVVSVPVMANNQFAIPAGAFLRGEIDKASQSSTGDERSVLALRFTELEINSAKVPVSTQVISVDNARETVDDQGQISGILASETITGRLDDEL